MQSYNDAPMDVSKKLSIAKRNCQGKGKENFMKSSACLQQNKQKQTVQNTEPHGPMKSKLPVLSKARAPPDFQKMHQSWQTQFQRGKALCKKSCTRPQPYNFTQRGERPQVQVADVSSGASSSGHPPRNSPAGHKIREPLTDVVLRQNKKESSVVKGGSEVDFKADPAALASILSNIGVSAAPVGKVSLAQRVPMRAASSIAHPRNSNKNTMIRSSMYTVSNCQAGPSNMDRISCFSKMTGKAYEQKPLFRMQNRNPVPETSVKAPGGLKKDELYTQENPVLQQMNPHVPASDEMSCSVTTQEDHLTKLTSLPTKTDQPSTVLSTQQCETSSTEENGIAGKKDFVKNTDTCPVDFVADSQALASILSNTEMNSTNCRKLSVAQRVPMQGRSSMLKSAMALSGTLLTQAASPKPACGPKSNVTVPLKDTCPVDFVADSQALASILSNTEMNSTNCRKLSLAQRVPMQGRSSMFKGAMALSGTFLTQAASPKPACGPKSNVTVPLKELMFSPCRVPLVTSDKNSGGSARRVLQPQSSTMKFSQPYSVTSKQPVFPKTPRALALEKANKCLESEKRVQTSSKSIVKWADEMSPSSLSEALRVQEPDMEGVAKRLILDGEGAGDSEKKKEPTAVSDPLIVLERPPTNAPLQKELVQPDAHNANVGDSPNFQLHSQMHLAPSLKPSASDSSSSIVSGIKSSVPLSFLAHPVVKALQSCTLGPSSLPDIARLRLQAAVSARQRFWEARLDEECAFYTTQGVFGSIRSCRDPVSVFLEKQEDMHFTPIFPGES